MEYWPSTHEALGFIPSILDENKNCPGAIDNKGGRFSKGGGKPPGGPPKGFSLLGPRRIKLILQRPKPHNLGNELALLVTY